MDKFSKKGLYISGSLHALFFIALIFAFLLSNCSSKRKQHHVFVLEASPGKMLATTAPKKPAAVIPVKPAVTTPEKPSAPAPDISPVAVPPPIAKTIPKPKIPSTTPPLPTLPKVNTEPKPVVKKVTQETKMSYEDFVKAQGTPVVKESKAVAVQAVTVPRIQTPDIKKNFEEKLSSIAALSSTTGESGGVVAEYQDYVRSMIDSSWEQPKDFSGYSNGALIEFDIDKFGRIYNVRVVKSSGSRIFDESVQHAFARVGGVKATPDGRSLAGCRLTFTKKGKGSK